MSRRIAFFDFDGTITNKDTLLEMIRYHAGSTRYWLGFALNSPFLVAFRLGLLGNQQAKEIMLRYFFGRMPADAFAVVCRRFAEEKIPAMIRPKALQEIQKLQAAGAEVVIVSASPEDWIRPWSEALGLCLMATRLETKAGQLTGRISGNNCHGEEKVRRIREGYNLADYNEIYCYGDTKGDKPMLSLATFSFYQPFR
ncbi:MAG: HAD-IB family hydrolase [Candidatus Pseudobacter hemicellulosilyticus]|uniref:HAD-IB family hydrolase n=1 Tax=Candidatus Pseudobacter hemicellulosilyticus TaxID=3121375 RepID=A0AAJ6BHG3_9BACT|nr:MAG: HAD-IB family hydrolase [Pseudobacter sp.]